MHVIDSIGEHIRTYSRTYPGPIPYKVFLGLGMSIMCSPNLHDNPLQSSISVSCYYQSEIYTHITDSFTDWPKQCNRNKSLVLHRMLHK